MLTYAAKYLPLALVIMSYGRVYADPMTVTVFCDNGRKITNLAIQVFDKNGEQVNATSPTDSKGKFQIPNPEDYLLPFEISFQNREGSTCSGYQVRQKTETAWFVALPYIPTESSCSCVNLTEDWPGKSDN
jgi:hypothetical protein